MPLDPIPDAWEIAMNGHLSPGLENWAMVFGVRDTDGHDTTRANALGAVFVDWWDSEISAHIGDFCFLDQVRVTDLDDPGGVSILYTTGLPSSGAGTGGPAGAQCSVVVTLVTAIRGRAYRGRKYVPGQTADNMNVGDGAIWNDDLVAAVQADFDALSPMVEAVGSCEVAVNSHSVLASTPVTSFIARKRMATQRRRTK